MKEIVKLIPSGKKILVEQVAFVNKVPFFPPYEVFDKYKDDIEGLAAYMISKHPDKKDDIEKILKQLIKGE